MKKPSALAIMTDTLIQFGILAGLGYILFSLYIVHRRYNILLSEYIQLLDIYRKFYDACKKDIDKETYWDFVDDNGDAIRIINK